MSSFTSSSTSYLCSCVKFEFWYLWPGDMNVHHIIRSSCFTLSVLTHVILDLLIRCYRFVPIPFTFRQFLQFPPDIVAKLVRYTRGLYFFQWDTSLSFEHHLISLLILTSLLCFRCSHSLIFELFSCGMSEWYELYCWTGSFSNTTYWYIIFNIFIFTLFVECNVFASISSNEWIWREVRYSFVVVATCFVSPPRRRYWMNWKLSSSNFWIYIIFSFDLRTRAQVQRGFVSRCIVRLWFQRSWNFVKLLLYPLSSLMKYWYFYRLFPPWATLFARSRNRLCVRIAFTFSSNSRPSATSRFWVPRISQSPNSWTSSMPENPTLLIPLLKCLVTHCIVFRFCGYIFRQTSLKTVHEDVGDGI